MASDHDGEGISSGRGPKEPRWPASLAIAAALRLYMTLPGKLTIGPGWVIPALEGALLIPLTVRAPYRHREEVRLVRSASLLLIALVNLANVASLALLVRVVLSGGAVSGRQLVFSGIQIWLTLILVFALWYWELDRGGRQERRSHERAVRTAANEDQRTMAVTSWKLLAHLRPKAALGDDAPPRARWS